MQHFLIDIFNNILGSVREPLVLLDSDLKIVKANHSFYKTFCVKPEETEGVLIRLVDDLSEPYKHLRKNQKTLEAVESDYILRVLEQTHWKVSGKNSAAQILGLNRITLRARMRKRNIVKPQARLQNYLNF